MGIRGCSDNSTRTSVILRISKRLSARTGQPGHMQGHSAMDIRKQ